MISQNKVCEFTTNGYSRNPYATIAIATLAGMSLMFTGIALGLHIFINMCLLIIGILLVFGNFMGKVTFVLYREGVEQKIRNVIPFYLKKKEEIRWIGWADIKAFKFDMEMSRQMKKYQIIKLYLSVEPKEVWITNQLNDGGFQQFKAEFISLIDEAKQPDYKFSKTGDLEMSVKSKPLGLDKIDEKPSFYSGILARVLTVLFVVLSVLILAYGLVEGMRSANWYRLLLILFPGTIYMVYRVFIRSDKE